jgi:hypothetical protein
MAASVTLWSQEQNAVGQHDQNGQRSQSFLLVFVLLHVFLHFLLKINFFLLYDQCSRKWQLIWTWTHPVAILNSPRKGLTGPACDGCYRGSAIDGNQCYLVRPEQLKPSCWKGGGAVSRKRAGRQINLYFFFERLTIWVD